MCFCDQLFHAHALLGALVEDSASSQWWMSGSCWLHSDTTKPGVTRKVDLYVNAPINSHEHTNATRNLCFGGNDFSEDWSALLAMKSIVKPKFEWVPPEEPTDLGMCVETHEHQRKISGKPGFEDENTNIGDQQKIQHQVSSGIRDESASNPCGILDKSEKDLFNVAHFNPGSTPTVARAHESMVMVPPKCVFLMSDLTAFSHQARLLTRNGRFDLIVLDPPWENKSVKRKRPYQTLPNWSLLELPMPELMRRVGIPTNRMQTVEHTLPDYSECACLWTMYLLVTRHINICLDAEALGVHPSHPLFIVF